jgi:flagellar export protein FliJ
MKPFFFRARVALEHRRRRDEDAQRELAAAEMRRLSAAEQLEGASAALRRGLDQAGVAERRTADVTARVWHRNWIVGQRLEVERCAAQVTQRERDVEDAARHAQVAHRQRESLERLHDRALSAWQDAARHAEQKAIDELAGVRFWRARAGGEP